MDRPPRAPDAPLFAPRALLASSAQGLLVMAGVAAEATEKAHALAGQGAVTLLMRSTIAPVSGEDGDAGRRSHEKSRRSVHVSEEPSAATLVTAHGMENASSVTGKE